MLAKDKIENALDGLYFERGLSSAQRSAIVNVWMFEQIYLRKRKPSEILGRIATIMPKKIKGKKVKFTGTPVPGECIGKGEEQ